MALSRARGRYGSDAASVGAEIAAMERAAERSPDNPGEYFRVPASAMIFH